MKDSRKFVTNEEGKLLEKIQSKTEKFQKIYWSGAIALFVSMIPWAVIDIIIASYFSGFELIMCIVLAGIILIPLGIYWEIYLFPLGKEIDKLQEKYKNEYISSG
ncbi:hypothetical protein KAU40_02045 [Candidatus Parcubacteria bacterium]|nr:hypothetical protein [Candidatus Parcubacteria bacterium]